MRHGKIAPNSLDGKIIAKGSNNYAMGDTLFNNVELLLQADSIGGISDSSLTPKTINVSGTVAVSTTIKKSGIGSLDFTSANGYLHVQPSVFNFGTATDFTVEFWLYTTTNNRQYDQFMGQWEIADSFQFSNLNYQVGIQDPSGTVTFGRAMSTIPVNTWTHIAYSRTGSSLKLFINGVGSNASRNANISPNLSHNVGIGKTYNQSGFDMNGYMDNVRVTKGIGRYTSDFNPELINYAAASLNSGSVQFNSQGDIAGASDLHWDEATLRLGVGTSTPAEKVHVKDGNVRIEGTAGTHGLIFPDASKQTTAATPYSLPTASTTALGGVKVDGTSVTINGSGVISAASSNGTPGFEQAFLLMGV